MKKKKILGIGALVVGMIVLGIGVAFLAINLAKSERLADGEFLVAAGVWTLAETSDASGAGEMTEVDESAVIWDFTEIGKGVLTTDAHQNDYDFIWALEGGKIKIETDWLETLEDEYGYTLDQEAKVLTLSRGDEQVKFVAK